MQPGEICKSTVATDDTGADESLRLIEASPADANYFHLETT